MHDHDFNTEVLLCCETSEQELISELSTIQAIRINFRIIQTIRINIRIIQTIRINFRIIQTIRINFRIIQTYGLISALSRPTD